MFWSSILAHGRLISGTAPRPVHGNSVMLIHKAIAHWVWWFTYLTNGEWIHVAKSQFPSWIYLRWYSPDIPSMFRWYSRHFETCDFRSPTDRYSHEIPQIFHDIPQIFHDIPMIFPWYQHTSPEMSLHHAPRCHGIRLFDVVPAWWKTRGNSPGKMIHGGYPQMHGL